MVLKGFMSEFESRLVSHCEAALKEDLDLVQQLSLVVQFSLFRLEVKSRDLTIDRPGATLTNPQTI